MFKSKQTALKNPNPRNWDAKTQALASANLAFYASEVLTGPPEAPFHGKFLIARHHLEWADIISKHKRICLLAARGHGKSQMISLAYALWMAEKYPDKDTLILSGSDRLADRIMINIRKELESNPQLAHLVPDRSEQRQWSNSKMRLKNGHTIKSYGYGANIRGEHPICLICDDILSNSDATSKKVREDNIETFFTSVLHTVLPNGQTVVIGTPLHEQDLYARLRDSGEFFFKAFPGIYVDPKDNQEKALWPEYIPLTDLYQKKNITGAALFSREILCVPRSDDMSLFPSYLFRDPAVVTNRTLGEGLGYWRDIKFQAVVMAVDIAISAETKADYTVVWTMGVDEHKNRWILNYERRKGLRFDKQLDLIKEEAAKYRPAVISIEAVQMQRVWGDELIRTTDLPIRQFNTTKQKHSLDKGVPKLRMLLENKKFRIPMGDEVSRKKMQVWIDEMSGMSVIDGAVISTGAHDDTVMALYIANEAVDSMGFGFSFNERPGDKAVFDAMVEAANKPLSPEDFDAINFGLPKTVEPEQLKPYSEVRPRDTIGSLFPGFFKRS